MKLEAIRNIKRGITPDAAWVLRTREILLMQVGNSMPAASISMWSRWRMMGRSFLPSRWLAVVRGPMLAFLSVLSVALGGSIATVSAAERSLPGDFFHPVKLAIEQTRLAFTSGTKDKLKLKTEFLSGRLQEMRDIASSKGDERQARIKASAEMLKRDFDTVKTQLNEVTHQESVGQQLAETAKLIDQTSADALDALKKVKPSVSAEAQAKVAEAEVAAVNTGVKAVQILVVAHDTPHLKEVMSNEELIKSIHGKVQGMEDNIADASKALSGASSSSTGAGASSSTAMGQINTAKESLTQTKQLLEEHKLTEVTASLLETVKVVTTAEKTAVEFNALNGNTISATGTEQIKLNAPTSSTTKPSSP